MKIPYRKRRLKFYLILGITAVILTPDNIFNYGYLIIGILHLGTYLYENNKQYLTIENGIITINHLIPKKINLSEINSIKEFAGDYTLKTDSTELKIYTELIEEKSLEKLNAVLANLNSETK